MSNITSDVIVLAEDSRPSFDIQNASFFFFFPFSIWKQWETLLEHGCISGMKMVVQRNGYEEMKGFLECCICCLHVGKPKKSLGSF